LHADCRKRHVFCKKTAKAAPLTAAGEAGVAQIAPREWGGTHPFN